VGTQQTRKMIKFEEKMNAFEIAEKDIEWDELDIIGKGGSGTVVKGRWLGSTTVAVKILNGAGKYCRFYSKL
jgi:hypothetical protein